ARPANLPTVTLPSRTGYNGANLRIFRTLSSTGRAQSLQPEKRFVNQFRARGSMRLYQRLLTAVSLFIVFVLLLPGQDTTGKVTGIITDPSGGVVSDVRVSVTNTATNLNKETI